MDDAEMTLDQFQCPNVQLQRTNHLWALYRSTYVSRHTQL